MLSNKDFDFCSFNIANRDLHLDTKRKINKLICFA